MGTALMKDSISKAASLAPRRANLPFDCNGAAVRAQCRHLATVVTISGTIDASDVYPSIKHAQRLNFPHKPFVLELSGVDSFAAQAVRLLLRVDDACSAAGLE